MKKLISIICLVAVAQFSIFAQERSEANKPGAGGAQFKVTCEVPSTIFVDEITATSATIHWNTTGAAYYKVQYYNVKDPQDSGLLMTNLGSVMLDNLQPCATYRFVISAKCPGGVSRSVIQAFSTTCR